MDMLIAMGVPSALTGFLIWWLKKYMDKLEARRDKREANLERFMKYTMANSRATNILAEATAKAVQRIPDAHCNGDMTSALEEAARIQKEEKEFLFEQGIEHIFGNN